MRNRAAATIIALIAVLGIAVASAAPAAAAKKGNGKKNTVAAATVAPAARPATIPAVTVPTPTQSVQPTAVRTGFSSVVGVDPATLRTGLTITFPDGAAVPATVTVVVSVNGTPIWSGAAATTGTVTTVQLTVTSPAQFTLDDVTITAVA